jgi:CTP:phosphocholine cytidylyltransferase-like protein
MDLDIKKSLIAAILKTENEEILEAIKNLLRIEDKVDFWDQLSKKDQEAINEGIRQLDEGKSVSFDEVKDLIKERFNF